MLTSLLAAALLCACGGSSPKRVLPTARLVLDFTPNAVHAGIYAALGEGFDRAAGVRLRVLAPTASTDSIKLLETGRTDFAILDIHDLAIARERGADIVGLMAIVERPLAAVIAAPRFASPAALAGQTVGVTGVPSDTAVLDSIVAGAGGDPRRLHLVTIGFDAVPDLLAGRVAAATAFWNDEGVTVRERAPGFHVFRVDAYGAPPYPELVLCAARRTVRARPRLLAATVSALVRGYRFALSRPGRAAADLEARAPGLDPRLVAAQLRALLPAFRPADGRPGELSRAVLEAWAGWETRFGIVARRPEVAADFDLALNRRLTAG